ncbi:MAG: glutamate racemase [Anaerovoracaceae bacterium]|jgi:glutamate racemase
MDNRPIGIFDSGLGGLTCVSPLMKAFPNEQIIYFGDTARTPYGSKASKTIRTFSNQIADFLIQSHVKMVVIACNTVSAICLDELQNRYPDTPFIGIINPAAKAVANLCTTDNSIGIIGTKVTIKSKAYENAINNFNPGLRISSTPCPILVPLIEEGIIRNDIMDLAIRHYLDPYLSYNRIDTLILGCTHYPLIRDNIEKIYPDLHIINPSDEIANTVGLELKARNMFADKKHGDDTFYASDLSDNFVNMINRIFELSQFKVAFKNFDLDVCNQ